MGRAVRALALGVVLAVSAPAHAQTSSATLAAGYRDLMLTWKQRALTCRADLTSCQSEVEALQDFSLESRAASLDPPPPQPIPERVPVLYWVVTIAGAVALTAGGTALGWWLGHRAR